MEYGYNANPSEADKIVRRLSLEHGETAMFAGKCSNWLPVAADWIVVTNSRLIASPAMGVKAAWEAAHIDIASAVGDSDKKSLTVTRANGESSTFKKVAVEDHAAIIGYVSGSRSAPLSVAPTVAEPVAATPHPKKEGGFADVMKKAAADVKAAAQEQRAQTAAAFAEGKEKAGNLAHTAVFGGTTVEVYEGGYVRVGKFLNKSSAFEKLRSVSYTQQVQDKSAGGRAMAGLATGA
jgi:hypothetical protein